MTESPGALLSRKRIVQIAGIADAEEARLVISCGVDLLGFPLGSGCSGGDADEEETAKILGALRPPVYGVLVTYSGSAETVAAQCRRVGFRAVQLHGDMDVGAIRRLRELVPGVFLVKTVAVRGSDPCRSLEAVARYEGDVDAFLADTFDEATGRWGATGKTHDWSVSRRIVERSQRPVILAGGLTPENVGQAIAEVAPAGVDAHTGVEDLAGRKDPRKLAAFVEQARRAFGSL